MTMESTIWREWRPRQGDAEAKLTLAEARRLNPQLTIKWFSEHWPLPPTIIVDGWRKAGVPEG
jgi:hypothetical protein